MLAKELSLAKHNHPELSPLEVALGEGHIAQVWSFDLGTDLVVFLISPLSSNRCWAWSQFMREQGLYRNGLS